MTIRASVAPANDQVKNLKAALRTGGASHHQAAKIPQPSSAIMITTVGSEKPPKIKAMKKLTGYNQREEEVLAVKDMERKRKAAKYVMKTSGAKWVAMAERQYKV